MYTINNLYIVCITYELSKFASYTYFQNLFVYTMNNIKHKILYTREYMLLLSLNLVNNYFEISDIIKIIFCPSTIVKGL